MRSCKSPSKYCSLSFLKELQNNYYISETGCDYEAFEVDQLIIEKEEAAAMKLLAQMNDYLDETIEEEEIPFPQDCDFTTEAVEIFAVAKKIAKKIAKKVTKMAVDKFDKYLANRNPTLKKFRVNEQKVKVSVTIDEQHFEYAKSYKSISYFIQICIKEHIHRVMTDST